MSASMPGMQLSDDGDSAARASLLNEAARMSIRHVSEHVALEHVDCEEMELTAISFFMHQVRLHHPGRMHPATCRQSVKGTPLIGSLLPGARSSLSAQPETKVAETPKSVASGDTSALCCLSLGCARDQVTYRCGTCIGMWQCIV